MKNVDKEVLKYVTNKVNGICKVCDSYLMMYHAFKEFFVEITNPDSPRFDEFTKTYNVQEIARSKVKTFRKYPLKKGFNDKHEGKFFVRPEIYFYDKAPFGILLLLCLFKADRRPAIPIALDMFVKESF